MSDTETKLKLRVILVTLAMLTLAWGLVAYDLVRTRNGYLREAEVKTQIQAQVFAEYGLASVRRIDELLLDSREAWLAGPGELAEHIELRHNHGIDDLSLQIGIIDRMGFLAFTNLTATKERIDLSERAHFTVHRDSGGKDRLYVSDPVKGKVSGKRTLQFTRPVLRHGRFDGVVVVSVSPTYFTQFAEKLSMGQQRVVALARDSGTVLARVPNVDAVPKAVVAQIPAQGEGQKISGTYIAVSPMDNIERVYGYQRIPAFGLVFTVGESIAEVLQPYESHRKFVLSAATLASVLGLLFAYFFHRALAVRQKTFGKLVESEGRFRFLMDASPIAVRIAAADGRLVQFANPRYQQLINARADEVIGADPKTYYANPQDYENILAALATGRSVVDKLVELRIPGSGTKWALASYLHIVYEGKNAVLGWFYDVTALKNAESRLRLAANVFTHAREGITITDPEGTIVEVNDAFSRLTGYRREEVLGQNPRILKSGRQSPEYYAAMWEAIRETGFWSGEIWNRRKDGQVYAELLTISAIHDESGRVQNYVALFTDITSIKEHEIQLERIAHYDALTGLPNRILLADRLQQAMAQSQRRGKLLAVAYLDLDGFKAINDMYGHDVGDDLLLAVSKRMKVALREGDTLARIGGDEFIGVLEDLEDTHALAPVLTRLLQAASEPLLAQGHLLRVSASIGVTLYPQDAAEADLLVRHADQAMYQAKVAGKNRYHLFDVDQDVAVKVHHESLEHVARALEAEEFVLHYQPKVNMRTGEVVGAEALIRWQHPERGLLSPAEFLPGVEGHPVGIALGKWVLETALSQLASWKAQGTEVPVSINVGAAQLLQEDFVRHLKEALARQPTLRPQQLEIEILETSALEDMAQVSQTIRACEELGVRFALDDFGTGYSSLTYLKRLPAGQLKIDQSFVRDMLDDPEDLAIVEGVVSLAAAFRRQVIAEGVESLDHGTALLPLGCEFAQGYGIARPMPAENFPEWSARWKPHDDWMAWRDRSATPADLALLFTEVELRHWSGRLEIFVAGDLAEPLAVSSQQCYFGRWQRSDGRLRFGETQGFHALSATHESVHTLGQRVIECYREGRHGEALAAVAEFRRTADELLRGMRELIGAPPVGRGAAEPAEADVRR